MKYLKLFEDHKETSDKIEEIEREAKEKREEVINQYKLLIDEMMYDITDDYQTTSAINISEVDRSICQYVRTYVDYDIIFSIDKYEEFLKNLLEVVSRLKEAYDIKHNIFGIYEASTGKRLGGCPSYYRMPYDFDETRKIIKNYIMFSSALDDNLKIRISF